ncbi:MAG: hypothetical protein Q4D91_04895 [Lautropia sp.]|nr:hypothetical protein [Lautropia sp.]
MHPSIEQGQAMTETLVLAIAVVPFLIAIPLVAKYQDIRHATVAASRTAAFECSIRPEACADTEGQAEIEAHVRRRHFSQRQIDVHSHDLPTDLSVQADGNRFWRNREGQPLIARLDDISLSIRHEWADAMQKGYGEAEKRVGHVRLSSSNPPDHGAAPGEEAPSKSPKLMRLAEAMSQVVGPDAFGMPFFGGLVSATVESRAWFDPKLVQGLTWDRPLDQPLSLASKTVVLTDSWNASSAKGREAQSLQSRVDQGKRLPNLARFSSLSQELIGMAPPEVIANSSATDPESLFSLIYTPLVDMMHRLDRMGADLVVPHGERFRRLEVDVEKVPEDRLKKP